MAGIATPNIVTYMLNSTLVRSGEVTGADWVGGLNRGGSCAPGVGINTGDYDPKDTDWSRQVRDPQNSQHLGTAGAVIQAIQGADVNDQLSFVQTAGDIAPGGALITGVVNRTGKTVPSGSWAWGTKTVA